MFHHYPCLVPFHRLEDFYTLVEASLELGADVGVKERAYHRFNAFFDIDLPKPAVPAPLQPPANEDSEEVDIPDSQYGDAMDVDLFLDQSQPPQLDGMDNYPRSARQAADLAYSELGVPREHKVLIVWREDADGYKHFHIHVPGWQVTANKLRAIVRRSERDAPFLDAAVYNPPNLRVPYTNKVFQGQKKPYQHWAMFEYDQDDGTIRQHLADLGIADVMLKATLQTEQRAPLEGNYMADYDRLPDGRLRCWWHAFVDPRHDHENYVSMDWTDTTIDHTEVLVLGMADYYTTRGEQVLDPDFVVQDLQGFRMQIATVMKKIWAYLPTTRNGPMAIYKNVSVFGNATCEVMKWNEFKRNLQDFKISYVTEDGEDRQGETKYKKREEKVVVIFEQYANRVEASYHGFYYGLKVYQHAKEGQRWFNTYTGLPYTQREAFTYVHDHLQESIQVMDDFYALVKELMRDRNETDPLVHRCFRYLLLVWIACQLQMPGTRFTYGMFMVRAIEGIGKSWLLKYIMHMVGRDNAISSSDFGQLFGRFNDTLVGKNLLVLEEASLNDREQNDPRQAQYRANMKNNQTADAIAVERKGMKITPEIVTYNMIGATNDPSTLDGRRVWQVTPGDRCKRERANDPDVKDTIYVGILDRIRLYFEVEKDRMKALQVAFLTFPLPEEEDLERIRSMDAPLGNTAMLLKREFNTPSIIHLFIQWVESDRGNSHYKGYFISQRNEEYKCPDDATSNPAYDKWCRVRGADWCALVDLKYVAVQVGVQIQTVKKALFNLFGGNFERSYGAKQRPDGSPENDCYCEHFVQGGVVPPFIAVPGGVQGQRNVKVIPQGSTDASIPYQPTLALIPSREKFRQALKDQGYLKDKRLPHEGPNACVQVQGNAVSAILDDEEGELWYHNVFNDIAQAPIY